jgi:sestrin 1/3
VNDLLHRTLKKYIETAACYPERCSPEEYRAIMPDFRLSEKIHVCLITAEAKFQSELLYALRAVVTHFSSCNP